MTRKQLENRGWTVVAWEEPKLVPTSWTASGKVRAQERREGRLGVEKHAPDGRVVRAEATSTAELAGFRERLKVALGASDAA
jgi:hypothetical protein